jgi:hypothetical protein
MGDISFFFFLEEKTAIWLRNTLWGMSPRRSPTYAISRYAISDSKDFRKIKTKIKQNFWKAPNLSLSELKCYGTKVEEEYCRAITKEAWRSGSSLLEFGFQVECNGYRHKFDHMYTRLRRVPDFTGHNYCEILRVSVHVTLPDSPHSGFL